MHSSPGGLDAQVLAGWEKMVAKNVFQVEKWVEAHNNLLARFAKEGPGAQVILVSDSVVSASELKILRILDTLKTLPITSTT